jgi:hypothetical protein
MVDYNYDTYYVDKTSYDRNRKKLSLAKQNQNLRDEEIKKRKIINCWFSNRDQSWSVIENKLSEIIQGVDKRHIIKLITNNEYKVLFNDTKEELDKFIDSRKSIINSNNHKIEIKEMVDAILDQEYRYIVNSQNIENSFIVKKPRLFLTLQQFDNVRVFKRFKKVEDIKQGEWSVHTRHSNDPLAETLHIRYDKYNEITKHYEIKNDMIELCSQNMIFKIGITQSDQEFNLNDIEILDSKIRITGKNNIFVDIGRQMITNKINLITESYFDKESKKYIIIDVKLVPIKNYHRTTENKCICSKCINFLIKSFTQKSTYQTICINMTVARLREMRKEEDKYMYDLNTDMESQDSSEHDTTNHEIEDDIQKIVIRGNIIPNNNIIFKKITTRN